MVEGNEHHAIDEAEEALIQAGGFDIYQRGGLLVRPVLEPAHAADNRSTITWRFSPVKLPFLLALAGAATAWACFLWRPSCCLVSFIPSCSPRFSL